MTVHAIALPVSSHIGFCKTIIFVTHFSQLHHYFRPSSPVPVDLVAVALVVGVAAVVEHT
jgi:hypothetical protein